MTKRSMTSLNKQMQENYLKGWNAAYTHLWNHLQKPEGVKLKDGRIARAMIEDAPVAEPAAGVPATSEPEGQKGGSANSE